MKVTQGNDEEPSRDDRVANAVAQTLRSAVGGLAFQYATLRRCDGLLSEGFYTGRWQLLATELPVALKGEEFHIDGVLDFTTSSRKFRTVAVVECKKTDPKFSRWAFGRSREMPPPLVDVYTIEATTGRPHVAVHMIDLSGAVAGDIGLELKTKESTGDGQGRGLGEAVAQVHRGVGGFVERLQDWPPTRGQSVCLVPVIVTTAELFWTDALLQDANPDNGAIDLQVRRVPWVWYQIHLSASLLPAVQRREPQQSAPALDALNEQLLRRHARGVLIVHAEHLDGALAMLAQRNVTAL